MCINMKNIVNYDAMKLKNNKMVEEKWDKNMKPYVHVMRRNMCSRTDD